MTAEPPMHEQWIREAVELGRSGMHQSGGGPFGAVVVSNGKIIGRGWNQVTTQLDPTAHAEVTAIRDACRNMQRFELRGCDLYTSCEPCPMCLAAIYWARVGKLFYAATRRLKIRHAGATVWAERIGYNAVFAVGGARTRTPIG